MMKIDIMIAEDEPMAKKELIFLLEKEQDVALCPSAETGEELVELYEAHEPDVVFLDVHMPGMTGVEAAQKITEIAVLHPPLFVFTTAYDEYALDAFEIAAVDYLLKPYDDTRFHKAMERIRGRLAILEKEMLEREQQGSSSKLLVDDGERIVVVDPASIYYAVPFKRMLEIHTEEKVIYSRMNLQELENKLSGYDFFRTHRSYLVNLNHIQEITPWFNGTSNVTLNDKAQTTIPVSRSARKILLKLFHA